MIRLQFVMGPGISSSLIAWFSAGNFSHVDVVMSDGKLLGARSDEIGGAPPGVQIRDPFYEHWAKRVVMSIPSRAEQEFQFRNFLLQQIGKPYDKTAILGFATGRDWRAEDSWFCSELAAAALEEGGIFHDLYSPVNKITPAALALAFSAAGAVVE